MEYHQISLGTKWIYIGDNSRVGVRGISICKLKLNGGHTLLLHNVLYALDIRWDLASVIVLFDLGYSLNFNGTCVDVYLRTTYYGSSFFLVTVLLLIMIIVVFY